MDQFRKYSKSLVLIPNPIVYQVQAKNLTKKKMKKKHNGELKL